MAIVSSMWISLWLGSFAAVVASGWFYSNDEVPKGIYWLLVAVLLNGTSDAIFRRAENYKKRNGGETGAERRQATYRSSRQNRP
jgi:hypothetical protein